MKPSSYAIGATHEKRVRALLDAWAVEYEPQKKLRTSLGTTFEVDVWVPPTEARPAIAIECKEFGVAAKSIADSRRRKAQEALWSLIQLRRHCPEARGARIVVVTGKECFLPEQVALLRAELGPAFDVVCVESADDLRRCLGLDSGVLPIGSEGYGSNPGVRA